jgi:hypothetical protein
VKTAYLTLVAASVFWLANWMFRKVQKQPQIVVNNRIRVVETDTASAVSEEANELFEIGEQSPRIATTSLFSESTSAAKKPAIPTLTSSGFKLKKRIKK